MFTQKNRARLLMCSGIGLLICAYLLFFHNTLEARRAGLYSEDALLQLNASVSTSIKNNPTGIDFGFTPTDTDFSNLQMPLEHIDGYDYVGIVRIPKLNLSLPIINEWDELSLKKAPCRYAGSAYTGNLILCAHNYNQHFGRLQTLKLDDVIQLEDMDGNLFSYQIIQFVNLEKHQVSEMLDGEWDLTLFTCVKGGQKRFTVRCKLVSVNNVVSSS